MKKEFFVYVLHSQKLNRNYTGHTSNLISRLFRHNHKLEISTKNGTPWQLAYKEGPFETRGEAIIREKELKSGKGRDFLKSVRPGSPPRRTKD